MSTDTTRPDSAAAQAAYPDSALLAALGNVPADHQHQPKRVHPGGGLALPGGFLKWYDIHHTDAAIPMNTRDQARDFLRAEAAAGRLVLDDALGYAILHRCEGEFYFLIVCTWRNHNEMWQSVYERDGDGVFTFHPRVEDHSATQCVWELGATCHERLAWSKYLCSRRDETAKRAYLADVFDGEA